MDPQKNSQSKADAVFDRMMAAARQKSPLEKQYENADSLDDLMWLAAEPVLAAASSLAFSMNRPMRGRLSLRILKRFKPESYYSHENQRNGVYAQCILFVTDRICEHVQKFARHPPQRRAFEHLAANAGILYIQTLRLSPEEEELFKQTMAHAMLRHADTPPDGESDHLMRILKARGGMPSVKELGVLSSHALLDECLNLVDIVGLTTSVDRIASALGQD